MNSAANNIIEMWLQTAYYYREGENVEQNKDVAKLLYRAVLAGDSNNNQALYGLACCHEEFSDVFLDYCMKSAELGNAKAQHHMGRYFDGKGKFNDAAIWYEKAIENGNEASSFNLAHGALCTENYSFFDKNKALSIAQELYKKKPVWGAELFGKIHYYSVYKDLLDHEKAVYFFKEAVMLGDASSAWYIGKIYKEGNIPNRDPYDAVVWFEKAGRMGENDGYFELQRIHLFSNHEVHLDYNDEQLLKLLNDTYEVYPAFCDKLSQYYEDGTLGKVDYKLSDFHLNKYLEYLKTVNYYNGKLKPEKPIETHKAIRYKRWANYTIFLMEWDMYPEKRVEIMKKHEKEMDEEKSYSLEIIRTLAQLYLGYDCPIYAQIEDVKSEQIVLMREFAYVDEDNNPKKFETLSPEGIPSDIKKGFELLDKGIALGDKGCERILENCLQANLQLLRQALE